MDKNFDDLNKEEQKKYYWIPTNFPQYGLIKELNNPINFVKIFHTTPTNAPKWKVFGVKIKQLFQEKVIVNFN